MQLFLPGPGPLVHPTEQGIAGFDTAAPASFVVTATDSITFAESADRTAQSFSRPLPTDSITFSESVARTLAVAKTATDSVTFAESNTAAAGKTRTVTDSITFAENLT